MSIKYMNDAWDMPLNSPEKIVLLALADWANDDGLAYPGYKKLTQKTGMSESCLSKCIKILKGIGTLEVSNHSIFGNGKKVNVYQIKLRSELPITSTLLLLERIKELRKEHAKPNTSILLVPKLVSYSSNTSNLLDDTSVLTISSEPSEKEISLKSPRFKKPDLQQITAYIIENNYSVDAQAFFSHYESNGWMVGKTKMKDWQAALTGWNTRKFNDSGKANNHHPSKQPINQNFDNHSYGEVRDL